MRLILSSIIVFFGFFPSIGQERVLMIETPFTSLKVSGNIHLELIKSDRQQIVLAPENDPDELEVETSGEQLSLKTQTELTMEEALTVKLHYMQLSGLEITKGARVQSADTLHAEILQLEVLTGGKTELTILADSLSARVNQGADMILSGKARSQFINAYTWGNYLADELEVMDSYVKAATGAQVKIRAGRLLDASATSKAFVGYWGEPDQKKMKATVGGEITPLTE